MREQHKALTAGKTGRPELRLSVLEAIKSIGALHRLNAQPLDPLIASKLSDLVSQSLIVLKGFELARRELCRKYGTPNEGTKRYEMGENQEQFDAEIRALMQVELKVEMEPIRLEELANTCGACGRNQVTLSGVDLSALSWLIVKG